MLACPWRDFENFTLRKIANLDQMSFYKKETGWREFPQKQNQIVYILNLIQSLLVLFRL